MSKRAWFQSSAIFRAYLTEDYLHWTKGDLWCETQSFIELLEQIYEVPVEIIKSTIWTKTKITDEKLSLVGDTPRDFAKTIDKEKTT